MDSEISSYSASGHGLLTVGQEADSRCIYEENHISNFYGLYIVSSQTTAPEATDHVIPLKPLNQNTLSGCGNK